MAQTGWTRRRGWQSPTGLILCFGIVGALLTIPSPIASAAGLTEEIRVLSINDFHGRIEAAPGGGSAGAAVIAGAVAQRKAEYPNTIFVSAGDNVGASTFTSFIAEDLPTIDALRASELTVSAVGNHEFDRGFADLRDRIIPAYGSANLALGANVYEKGTTTPALAEHAIVDVGGKRIGFIGTVTEQTATSVTPSRISELDFGPQLAAADRVAQAIDGLVDATVLLAHDGTMATDCAVVASEQSVFGELVREASPLIDAIVSGHTHTPYSCVIGGRPVIQSGFYGSALGETVLEFDASTGNFVGARAAILPLLAEKQPLYPADPAVAQIVDDAVVQAAVLGGREVGAVSADIWRGGMPEAENRGVESALGNLVADIMLDSLRVDGTAVADIAVMNPGGLRTDLRYGADGTVTYRDVAGVLPFANSIFTVDLTGAQLKQLLEQQWYLSGDVEGKRHLSVSAGFSYSYAPSRPRGERIVEMQLQGEPISADGVYTIATHTFLVSGGDGFTVFSEGANTIDTGRNDLQIAVEYFEAHPRVSPPPLGRAQLFEETGPRPDSGPGPQDLAVSGSGDNRPRAVGGSILLLLATALLLFVRTARTSPCGPPPAS